MYLTCCQVNVGVVNSPLALWVFVLKKANRSNLQKRKISNPLWDLGNRFYLYRHV